MLSEYVMRVCFGLAEHHRGHTGLFDRAYQIAHTPSTSLAFAVPTGVGQRPNLRLTIGPMKAAFVIWFGTCSANNW
jgi:hypothetical protein